MSNDRKSLRKVADELAQVRKILGNIESRIDGDDSHKDSWYIVAMSVMVINVISIIINLIT